MFFFEKKNQKPLDFGVEVPASAGANEQESFASFLQKRRPSSNHGILDARRAGRAREAGRRSSVAGRDGGAPPTTGLPFCAASGESSA
jgi:hypothetical protein